MAVHILSCSVFEPELEESLRQIRNENLLPGVEIKVTYIPAGLHFFLGGMQEKIIENIEKIKHERVILLYGSMCHPNIKDFTKDYDIVTFDEQNCFRLIMPEQPDFSGEFFLTTGWFVCDDFFATNDVAGREGMGLYDKILFANTNVCQITDEQMLKIFDKTGVPIETMDVSLEFFKNRILNAITLASR